MRKHRLVVAAVLAAGAVLVTCGCGSGSKSAVGKTGPTKSEFAAQLNTLCSKYLKEAAALGNPSSSAEAMRLLKKMRGIFAQRVADAKKLAPPADEQGSVNRLVVLSEQQLGIIDGMVGAIKKKDSVEYKKLVKSGDATDKESSQIFARLGATTCSP